MLNKNKRRYIRKRNKIYPDKIHFGYLYIRSLCNNLILTCSNTIGNPMFTLSSGIFGFHGTKKMSQLVVDTILTKCIVNLKSLACKFIYIKLYNMDNTFNFELLFKQLLENKIQITEIAEYQLIPHNGCRSPKKRRV